MIRKAQESGNVIDLTSSFLVMFFAFALLLLFLVFSKTAAVKLSIDMVAKDTIYKMEEVGCMTTEIEDGFKQQLKDNGIYVTAASGTKNASITRQSGTTTTQQQYGDEVTLDYIIYFDNPLYDQGLLQFFPAAQNKTISYHVKRSTTSKW